MSNIDNIYLSHEYLNVWADYDNAQPVQLELNNNNSTFKLCFLIKPVPDFPDYYEAYSAYGYGGPVLIKGNPEVTFPFQKLMNKLSEMNIINMFTRFSPFLENQQYFPKDLIELNRRTVIRNLYPVDSIAELLKTFGKGTKWALKKSLNSELQIDIIRGTEVTPHHIKNFYRLYYENMKQKEAQSYYYFSEKFFEKNCLLLKDNITLFAAVLKGKWTAASLFLSDKSSAHYYFSSSDRAFYKYYPSDRIIFEAMIYFGKLGKKFMHFGGGNSLSEEDPLFKFKSKFGDKILDFYISKLVVKKEIYDKIRIEKGLTNSKYFLINDALEAIE